MVTKVLQHFVAHRPEFVSLHSGDFMTWIYLILISLAVFFVTITLVVIGQEISVFLAVALFIGIAYTAFRIATARLTKL